MLINSQIATNALKTCGFCLLVAGASLLWPPEISCAQTDTGSSVDESEQQVEPEPAESETDAEQETTGQITDQPPESIPVDTGKTPSRFIPSEEISEDFSVAFPVDI